MQNDAHVPNFEQLKCFTNASPQRLVHNKMQYLETMADAAFEILKEKFHYVSDQLELKSKQHQAVKERFLSYFKSYWNVEQEVSWSKIKCKRNVSGVCIVLQI